MTEQLQDLSQPEPPRCRRCGATGSILIIPVKPYQEDDDVNPDRLFTGCPDCGGTGFLALESES